MDLFITPLDENGKPIKKVDEVKKEEAPTNKFPSSTQFPTETPSTPLFNAVPTEQQVFTTPTTTPTTPSMSNEHLVKAQVTYLVLKMLIKLGMISMNSINLLLLASITHKSIQWLLVWVLEWIKL